MPLVERGDFNNVCDTGTDTIRKEKQARKALKGIHKTVYDYKEKSGENKAMPIVYLIQ